MSLDVRAGAPRAFYPEFADRPPPRNGRPGWDTGPERRLDAGRRLVRALGWIGVALALLSIGQLARTAAGSGRRRP